MQISPTRPGRPSSVFVSSDREDSPGSIGCGLGWDSFYSTLQIGECTAENCTPLEQALSKNDKSTNVNGKSGSGIGKLHKSALSDFGKTSLEALMKYFITASLLFHIMKLLLNKISDWNMFFTVHGLLRMPVWYIADRFLVLFFFSS